jgi:hypothetical protein
MLSSFVWILVLQTAVSAIAPRPALSVGLLNPPDYRGSALTLRIGDGAPCVIPASEPSTRCVLDIPIGADTLRIEGELQQIGSNKRPQRARGSKTLRLLDLGPLFAPLRDETRPFGERLRAFVAAKAALDARLPDSSSGTVEIDTAIRATDAQIRAAEQRLGYRLPREHVALLEHGQLNIDDSSTEEAADIKTTWDAMIRNWGTPADILAGETKPATKAVFRATTLLYTEVGDGLGGLLFHPASPACQGGPGFYFVHQDDINDPLLLKHEDGACHSYADAMRWLLMTQALVGYQDSDDNLVIIDRASPVPARMRLEPLATGGFEFVLRGEWETWR